MSFILAPHCINHDISSSREESLSVLAFLLGRGETDSLNPPTLQVCGISSEGPKGRQLPILNEVNDQRNVSQMQAVTSQYK